MVLSLHRLPIEIRVTLWAASMRRGEKTVPTEDEYRDMASALSYAGLVELWEAIEARNTPGWEPGKAFEYSILRAFELEGAQVTWPYSVEFSGDTLHLRRFFFGQAARSITRYETK